MHDIPFPLSPSLAYQLKSTPTVTCAHTRTTHTVRAHVHSTHTVRAHVHSTHTVRAHTHTHTQQTHTHICKWRVWLVDEKSEMYGFIRLQVR